ncbi:hypothetical protein L7F22_016547 [Adiantum nelumboides]|nr:hypothetical protein [Adiantum nelumboides]
MAGSSEKKDYYIRKFDGTNFTIWKQCMMDVLVNKGLATPLKDRKESVYNDDQWEELDARARATIRLHLGESIFFTIMDKTTAFELWDSLCLAWDGKSASNKVFSMKKLMCLSMKEELTSKGLNFDDEMKAIFLLCSLPASWDTFNTAISKSTHGGKLAFGDVTSALLTEEIRRQSLDSGGHGNVYMAGGSSHDRQRGRDRSYDRSQSRGRSNDKGNGRSKSCGCNMRNVECYHCHKKRHVKKDCYAFQREKGKALVVTKAKPPPPKSSVKIEELNVLESPSTLVPDVHLQLSDVLIFATNMPYDALLALDDCYAQTWIIDSGASFHVTPHREWFAIYSPMHGLIKLGDSHQLDILGIGDVKICMANGTQFMLKDVRHVPKLSKSLVSTE